MTPQTPSTPHDNYIPVMTFTSGLLLGDTKVFGLGFDRTTRLPCMLTNTTAPEFRVIDATDPDTGAQSSESPAAPSNELEDIWRNIQLMSDYESKKKVFKQQIQAWSDQRCIEARIEQVMQDELSLSDFDIDESQLIQWRIKQLATLTPNDQSSKEPKNA